MYFKNQIFLVYGLEKSGMAAMKYLCAKGAKVFCYDDNSTLLSNRGDELKKIGACPVTYEWIEAEFSKVDVLVISPAIPIDCAICKMARKNGQRIIGEMELALENSHFPIISVTGTNGKTTTVRMISEILSRSKIDNFTAGNIGLPLITEVDGDNSRVAVLEVSTFQMETTTSLNPHVGVILNLSPNHLDRHYNMEFYCYLKKKTLLNQKESEYSVLNADDKIVASFANDLKSHVIWYSTQKKVDGCYVDGGNITYKGEVIMSVSDLALKEPHNISNAVAAIAAAKIAGATNDAIFKALSSFKPEKHRIELVRKIGDIAFYDDSKSTNTASTIAAIKSFKGKSGILIVGGKSKGERFNVLFESIKVSGIRQVIIYGETKLDLLDAAGACNYTAITMCPDFESAVKVACMMATSGEIVLLSPACSSKDEFKNYEERGDVFQSIIGKLDEKKQLKDKNR